MNKVKLDVIVPVRMPSDYLKGFRNQLRTQSDFVRFNFVLDSQDNSTLEDFGIDDLEANERFFVGKFGSPGCARNKGLEFADGDFICFWDVDDSPILEAALELIEEMIEFNASLGIGSWSLVDNQNEVYGNSVFDVGKNPGLWRFVFRKSNIENLLFCNSKWGEDQLYIAEAFCICPRIITSDKVLYRYKKGNPDSLTAHSEYAPDLGDVSKRLLKSYLILEGSKKDCVTIMLLRQIFTIFKHRRFDVGLKALIRLLYETNLSVFRLRTLLLIFNRGRSW